MSQTDTKTTEQSTLRRFTPRFLDGTRAEMRLTPEDFGKIGHGRRWFARITDQLTGQRFSVYGAPCGLRCYCDAIAEPINSEVK